MGLDNPLHIAILLLIVLLVFGAKRLPEIGRSLGGGLREFKHSVTGEGGHQAPQATLAAGPPPASAVQEQQVQPQQVQAPAQAPPTAQTPPAA